MALNFPQNPQQGDIYEADNGIRYEFDGTKWRGQTNSSGSSSGIRDRLVNGSNELVLNSTGNLSFPDGLTIDNSFIGYTTSDTISEETLGGTISQTTSYQNQIIVDTTDAIRIANILTQTVDDGVTVSTDAVGSTIDVDGTGIYIKRYVEPEGPNNSSYFQFSATNGGAILEGVDEDLAGNTYGRVTATQGVVAIEAAAGGINKSWSFDSDGNLTLPEGGDIKTAAGNSVLDTGTLQSSNGRLSTTLSNLGTLQTTALLPTSFTATVDGDHYVEQTPGVGLALTGDAWYFEVEFVVVDNGTVATQISNNTPWASNPGYQNDMQFAFTEEDHGIPGYTFTLTLTDIQNPGMFMYTTNLAASIAPAFPAALSATTPIKLTAGTSNFVFGPNGNLQLPLGGDIVDSNGNSVLGNGSSTLIYEFGEGRTHDAGFPVEGPFDFAVRLNTNLDQEFQTVWGFDSNGKMTLPNGGELWEDALIGAADQDFYLASKFTPEITRPADAGVGSTFVSNIEFDDDIIVVQVGWLVNVGGLDYTVSAVNSDTLNEYAITVTPAPGNPPATFETGTEYTFRSPVTVAKGWTIRQGTGTLVADGGAILSSDSFNNGEGQTYRDFSIDLAVPDGSNEVRWIFRNDGSVELPGDLTIGSNRISEDGLYSNQFRIAAGLGNHVEIRSDDGAKVWVFGTDGNIQLPENGDIINSNGQSVLVGGNANTGDVTFNTNKIFGTNNSLILKSEPDNEWNGLYGVELFNSIDNDTHFRPLSRDKGIAIGFAYGSNGSHIRVEGYAGQGAVNGTGDKVAIYAAREKVQQTATAGNDFFVNQLVGGANFTGWANEKAFGIEIDLFVSEGDFKTQLESYPIGTGITINYTVDGVQYTFVSTIQREFIVTGTEDTNTYIRMTGGVTTGSYQPGVKTVDSVSFDDYTASRTAEWIFENDGTLRLGTGFGAIYTDQSTGTVTIGDSIGEGGVPAAPSTTIKIGGNDSAFEISTYGFPSAAVWSFNKDKMMVFPGGGALNVKLTAPVSSKGAAGDKQGDVVFDENHLYWCKADYNPTLYTVQSTLQSDGVNSGFLVPDTYQLPEIGWVVIYGNQTSTINQVNNGGNPGFYTVFIDNPISINAYTDFQWGTPLPDIWVRMDWSSTSW